MQQPGCTSEEFKFHEIINLIYRTFQNKIIEYLLVLTSIWCP